MTMNTLLIVLLTVAALAYVWFRMRKKVQKERNPDDFEDLNEKFMRNASNKVGTVELVKVSHPDTLNLLRSLLDAEGIESYVIESAWGGVYPLTAVPGFTDAKITIFDVDREAAVQVVEDYLAGEPGNRAELLVTKE